MSTQNLPYSLPISTGVVKVIILQAIFAGATGFIFYYFNGKPLPWVYASLYGGSMAISNTIIMHQGVRSAAKIALHLPGNEVYTFYFSALQRFLLTVLLFIIGMAWLKLPPIPLLIGFGLAQGAFVFTHSKS